MEFIQQMRRVLSLAALSTVAPLSLVQGQTVSIPAAFSAMSRVVFSVESPAITLDACTVRSVAGQSLVDSLTARRFPMVRADSARQGTCSMRRNPPYRALVGIDTVPGGVDLRFTVVVGGRATEVVRVRRGAGGTLVAKERVQSDFMDVQDQPPPPPGRGGQDRERRLRLRSR